ncbi:MAG: lipopolysaccharide transport periplasmic protein LptA [Pseudomonadota bacterium]|nr:lipopolysaccharide transport periplasmic protein LptA [Pseudomonadota bacterium]
MLRTFLPLAFAWLAHAPCALAEKADRDKPINFQGDSLGGNTDTKISDLVGNVVITQGTLSIHADRIQFHQNPDNSVSAVATGNPVSFREKRDDVDEYYEGFAQRIVYDGSKRVVELFDRALLKRTGDELRGNYISYNAETNAYKAEGRPDSRPPAAGEPPLGPRVRGVFLPQSKDGKEAKESKDGKDGKAAAPKSNDPAALKPDSALKIDVGK